MTDKCFKAQLIYLKLHKQESKHVKPVKAIQATANQTALLQKWFGQHKCVTLTLILCIRDQSSGAQVLLKVTEQESQGHGPVPGINTMCQSR